VSIFRAPILNSLLIHTYKKLFDRAIIGGDTIVPHILKLRRVKNFHRLGKTFSPLIVFANNSFSKIRSIKSDRDGFISQNASKCKNVFSLY
jgi:hypothetical protein